MGTLDMYRIAEIILFCVILLITRGINIYLQNKNNDSEPKQTAAEENNESKQKYVFTEEDDRKLMEEGIASSEFKRAFMWDYNIVSPFYRMEMYIRKMTPELQLWGGAFMVE